VKLTYDRETDALYVRFSAVPIIESEEVRPGVVFDFDAEATSSPSRFLTR